MSAAKPACAAPVTILLNGRAVKACTLLAVQADGADVTTIEVERWARKRRKLDALREWRATSSASSVAKDR